MSWAFEHPWMTFVLGVLALAVLERFAISWGTR